MRPDTARINPGGSLARAGSACTDPDLHVLEISATAAEITAAAEVSTS